MVKKENPDALHPKAIFPKNPNDLKIVEGIGPKIEKLLKKSGINTLQELGATKEEKLREILETAGEAYRIHDPSTWPAQAALAAAGDWDKLKDYQDILLGGRELK
jgi:predicted flap endonuclease-1-like 5' DNA nuclease